MSDNNSGLILVVEDDDALRTAIRLNLVKRGRLVRESTTRRDALRAFDAGNPALLLLDLNLPDGSGVDLLVDLHARGIVLPTVVMSAAGISPLRLAATQPVWYLAKPFRIESLLDVVTLAESSGATIVAGDARSARVGLELPAWTRELRSACMTLTRASPRRIQSMTLSLRVAAASNELNLGSFARRLAGEYGLAARSELVDGMLRVWLGRDDGGTAADGSTQTPGATLELPSPEFECRATSAVRDSTIPIDGYSEVQ